MTGQLHQPTRARCIPAAPAVYRALHQAIRAGWVRSAHDLSEGGLGVAAAEMAIAGRLGMNLDLPGDDALQALFGETNGCLLVEVDRKHSRSHSKPNFQACHAGRIGQCHRSSRAVDFPPPAAGLLDSRSKP